jgi:hypothetical protein
MWKKLAILSDLGEPEFFLTCRAFKPDLGKKCEFIHACLPLSFAFTGKYHSLPYTFD